jgi:hypothetical protein
MAGCVLGTGLPQGGEALGAKAIFMTQDVSAEQLKALRLAAGLDAAILARQVSLSPAQLIQLESGQDSLFYTPAIGRQAARKVYFHLTGQWPANAELPSPSPEMPADDAPVQTPLEQTPLEQTPLELAALELAAPEPALVALPDQAPQIGAPWAVRPLFVASAVLTGLGLTVWLLVGRAMTPAPASPHQLAAQAPVMAPAADSPGLPSGPAGQPNSAAVLRDRPVGRAPGPDQNLVAMLPTSGRPVAPAMRAQTLAPAPCEDSDEPAVMVHLPMAEARAVRLVSAVSQWVCVTDGAGRPSQFGLSAGQGTVLAGPAPWVVQARSLRQVQIEVQGTKLAWPAELKNRAQLLAPQ